MKTLGHLALFGSFAAAGVGIAICVGMSTPVAGKPRKSIGQASVAQAQNDASPLASTPTRPGGPIGDGADLPRPEQTVLRFANSAASNVSSALASTSAETAPPPDKTVIGSAAQGMESVGIRIYRTSNITAAELKLLVAPLLTEKTGVVSVSVRNEAGIAANGVPAGGNKPSSNEVLVVRDYESVLAQIDKLVAEVDVRPVQISIEAIILGVKLREQDNSGVNFQSLSQNPNIRFDLGTSAASPMKGSMGNGLKFGFLEGNLDAFFEALEHIGQTDVIADVIANTKLTALSKSRLRTQLGQQRGCVNPMGTEATMGKSIQILDIGARLRLQPYVFSDGLIHMEIEPASDGASAPAGAVASNQAITQVITLRDGCTAVIGGVINQHPDNSRSQLPLMGNLPLAGSVYRQTNATPGPEEVLALITPRIVRETAPAAPTAPASKGATTASSGRHYRAAK
jgi:type II secretory pathway component GspD/PulD (secretin)